MFIQFFLTKNWVISKCKCFPILELITDAGVIIYIGGFLLIIAFIRYLYNFLML